MVYQFDTRMAPDSEFEPGALHHLVAGNTGRLLDPRRTPVRIERLRPETGTFVVEITAFEDRGARWDLPLEDISDFQFARDAARAEPADVAALEEAIRRFDRRIEITCDPDARARTLERLADRRARTDRWLRERSTFLFEGVTSLPLSSREGDRRLWLDMRAYMNALELRDVEDAFATRYVSNPRAGEMVKGHAIVIAELGLASYHGGMVRDASTFEGAFTKARRAEHVLARMAFVQAIFERTGNAEVMLYRGMALDGGLERRAPRGFVSATFSEDVAHALFAPRGGTPAGILYRQRTPASRLFMTYMETSQLNQNFKEAEAVMLAGEAGPLF